ncbi:MAG: LLM class flavin-dependent oxidoreductase [Acidimicrobiia bacterium]
MEIAWFGALCDDDYEFLGVPDPALASSWDHCRDIVQTADRLGFDNILLPSGYELGVDTTTFASAIATHTNDINLLVAVRMGETWLPQLAKQMASVDRMADGRLTINIISSDMPGQKLDSAPRYRRTIEWMQVLRALLNGESVDFHGEFVDLTIDPPRIRTVSGQCPPFYFGGFSDDAKDVAAREADVFLTWPDTVAAVGETAREMKDRAAGYGRDLLIGLRAHVIVRETEADAKAAADRLISRLDPEIGAAIRGKSLDAASVGVQRQAALRESADESGYAEPNLWTGIGKARSGAGAAIVGNPDQVVEKLEAYAGAGVSAFILSGYTHIGEAERFAEMVLPRLDHGKIHQSQT